MAIHSLPDLTSLSINELYNVYLLIARADHHWRIAALYGKQPRPAGHSEFRPLPWEHFSERFAIAQSIVGGEMSLRNRLARQAAAYRIDIDTELRRYRSQAA